MTSDRKLRRPERAQNEGSTGAKRLDDTRCTTYKRRIAERRIRPCHPASQNYSRPELSLLLSSSLSLSSLELSDKKSVSLKYEPSSEPLHISELRLLAGLVEGAAGAGGGENGARKQWQMQETEDDLFAM